jgi:cyclopropane-fatty-acyl-phospholipid synthase
MDPIRLSEQIYDRLTAAAGSTSVAMRAWDGTRWGPAAASATIVLNHPGALRALLLPPSDLTAAEAYVFGDVDFEGDVYAILEFARSLEPLAHQKLRAASLVTMLRRLPAEHRRPDRPRLRGRLHSRHRDKAAISGHYDTGNEFFMTFLDPLMVYSCAYFLDPAEPLETAQRRKLDLICRKLGLGSGMRFLDIGCGWGSLVIHAAIHYGVEAVGVTISHEQAELARQRIKEAGVEDRVTILEQDYRDIEGSFEAVASVGMFEHVGRTQLATYFEKVGQLLAPGGRFLNHGITNRDRTGAPKTATFVNTYVFPDGELVPVEDVIGSAAHAGFEVRDLESLRTSYAETLRRWVASIEMHRESAVALSSEVSYRIWRLYMAGSALAFGHAGISVYQLLLQRPDTPWRFGRAHLLAADDVETR